MSRGGPSACKTVSQAEWVAARGQITIARSHRLGHRGHPRVGSAVHPLTVRQTPEWRRGRGRWRGRGWGDAVRAQDGPCGRAVQAGPRLRRVGEGERRGVDDSVVPDQSHWDLHGLPHPAPAFPESRNVRHHAEDALSTPEQWPDGDGEFWPFDLFLLGTLCEVLNQELRFQTPRIAQNLTFAIKTVHGNSKAKFYWMTCSSHSRCEVWGHMPGSLTSENGELRWDEGGGGIFSTSIRGEIQQVILSGQDLSDYYCWCTSHH